MEILFSSRFILPAILIVSLLVGVHFLLKFVDQCIRKRFLRQYGQFIGKKGFVNIKTKRFLDENMLPVPGLEEVSFRPVYGLKKELIPCVLTDNGSYLDFQPINFAEDFEVKYVGEITVLYHPEYGEIIYQTDGLKTKPIVGQVIRFHSNFYLQALYSSYDFTWVEESSV